jgi:zinc protease
VSYPGKTLPILDLGYKGDAFDPQSRDFVAAQIFGELAFGLTSDLYKKLYITQQRVDALQASIPAQRDVPLFEILVRAKKEEDLDALREEVEGAIVRFQTTPVDARRLAEVKKRKKYSFLMNLDTPNKVAGGLAATIAITGGIEAVDVFYATIDTITPEDVQRAAAKYFVPERRTVVTLKGTRP